MLRVVVVGSLNMDLVVHVPRLPRPGETIVGGELRTYAGGKGANQAVAAARLGASVTMIGRVGDDDFGRQLSDSLQKEGVDVTRLQTDRRASTGIAMIAVEEGGQNSIVVSPGANMRLTLEDIAEARDAIDSADVLVMPLEVPMECIREAVRRAHASGVRVVLNPAPAQPLADDLLAMVTALVPNESETAWLTGLPVETIAQAERAAQVLLARGVGVVVLTLGERGALLLEQNQTARHLPAYPVDVVDTTAAGDAFVAALAVGLAEGASLDQAVRMANAAGALAVTCRGAQPAMPKRADLERFMRSRAGGW